MNAIVEPPDVLEVASDHATASVPVFPPATPAGQARAAMVGRRYESAVDVAVCEGDRLLGLVTIERLLAAAAAVPLGEIMDDTPPVVAPGVDQEVAAWTAVQENESSLAVVDEDQRFVGLVPPQRLLEVLLREHAEDLARLGGFLHDTESARAASSESVVRRFWHRMPWLLLGLAGAVLAAVIVGSFEATLEREVLVAFFVPGIVYMADAVGTQTETLIIRGLSVGVPLRAVVRQELLTGIAVGGTIAAVFLPVALVAWGSADVAIVVSLSLLLACSTATVIAMALPWLLHRLGRDPAFGSGPLATVVQDLLSITIYFVLASLLVS
jgi:magnesium transporter